MLSDTVRLKWAVFFFFYRFWAWQKKPNILLIRLAHWIDKIMNPSGDGPNQRGPFSTWEHEMEVIICNDGQRLSISAVTVEGWLRMLNASWKHGTIWPRNINIRLFVVMLQGYYTYIGIVTRQLMTRLGTVRPGVVVFTMAQLDRWGSMSRKVGQYYYKYLFSLDTVSVPFIIFPEFREWTFM